MSKRFKRQDYFRYKKFGTKWRKPKGRQSKLRKEKKGSGLKPKIGYKKKERFVVRVHINGKDKFFKPILIKTPDELIKINNEKEAALIASSVGSKKVTIIKEKAKQLGITILNMKKVKKAVKKSKEKIRKRQEKLKEKEKAAKEEKKKEKESKTIQTTKSQTKTDKKETKKKQKVISTKDVQKDKVMK